METEIPDINGAGESESDVSNDDNDDDNKEKDITTAVETDDECLLFVEAFVLAAKDGVQQLNLKIWEKGSVTCDQKFKSLNECWFVTSKSSWSNDDGDEEKQIECNAHVKVKVSEGKGVPAIKDFRVLTIYTKLSNKWHVCDKGKQVWKDDIDEG
eukprot:7475292-Ditylum_brightwellii.AAC.1